MTFLSSSFCLWDLILPQKPAHTGGRQSSGRAKVISSFSFTFAEWRRRLQSFRRVKLKVIHNLEHFYELWSVTKFLDGLWII